MDKKALSERDICTKFIAPAIAQAGWDIQRQVREEVTFTQGRDEHRVRPVNLTVAKDRYRARNPTVKTAINAGDRASHNGLVACIRMGDEMNQVFQ